MQEKETTDSKMTGYDVFVSYSSKDRQVADALVHALEQSRIRCWYAPRNINGGEDYPKAIARALSATRMTIFIVSAESLKSLWCGKEIVESISRRHAVLPCRIDDSEIPEEVRFTLSTTHWLDAFPDPEKSFADIRCSVYKLLGMTSQENNASDSSDSKITHETIVSAGDLASQVKATLFRTFRNAFDYRGISNRAEYWLYVCVSSALCFLALAIDVIIDWEDPWIMLLVLCALAFPFCSLCVRRLRDCGRSPWLLILCCLPYVGWIVCLYLGFGKGRRGHPCRSSLSRA